MADPTVTQLLNRAHAGDRGAAGELLPHVYAQLRRAAQAAMNNERASHTLQATALVHEAYVRLLGEHPGTWSGQAEFYFAASRAMQQLLIEHARSRGRIKRGGPDAKRVPLDLADLAESGDESEILALDEALGHLESVDPEAAAVVRLRFYAGLTGEQTAEALGVSPRQVDRVWSYARAVLFRHVRGSRSEEPA